MKDEWTKLKRAGTAYVWTKVVWEVLGIAMVLYAMWDFQYLIHVAASVLFQG